MAQTYTVAQRTVIRVQLMVATLSVVLLIAKLWAWQLTASVAILTDALESIVNVVTGFFGLYSVIIAARPRDKEHPYGHSKVEYISASVEGTLIIIAGVVIFYESVKRLFYPEPLQQLTYGLWLTAITGSINLLAGLYAITVGKRQRSLTVEAAGRHICSDAYSTYAILGGLLLLQVTGWAWIDSAVALLFGGFISFTGYKILRRSIGGIMDEADKVILMKVITALEAHRKPHWIDLHNMRVLQYGETLHLDAHLTLPWYHQVVQADEAAHEVEHLIMQTCENKVEVFLHIDACQPYSCKICSLQECKVRQHPFEQKIPWTMDTLWEDAKHGKE